MRVLVIFILTIHAWVGLRIDAKLVLAVNFHRVHYWTIALLHTWVLIGDKSIWPTLHDFFHMFHVLFGLCEFKVDLLTYFV